MGGGSDGSYQFSEGMLAIAAAVLDDDDDDALLEADDSTGWTTLLSSSRSTDARCTMSDASSLKFAQFS